MRKVVLSFIALAAVAGCSGTNKAAPTDSAGAAVSTRPAPVASADEATSVRNFLDARYTAQDVRHSFRSAQGQDIDCIDFFAQPGVRALAAQGHPIPSMPALPETPAGFRASEPNASTDSAGRVAFDGSTDDSGRARICPEGSVPQVRITAEQIQHAGGLEAFRRALHNKQAPPRASKSGPDTYGDCEGDTPGYAHVVGTVRTPYPEPIAAGSSVMSIHGPSVPDATVNYGHSIAQTWMIGYGQTNVQTVETGWNVDNWLYGDDTNVPHLFIFATDDDYATTGCYNDWDWAVGAAVNDAGQYEIDDAGNYVPSTCIPWVQLSRSYTPGMALPASVVHAVDPRKPSTLPKELSLSTVQIAGNWWIVVQVSGELPALLGYYSGASINEPMNYYQVGGEVDTNPLYGPDGGLESTDPFPGTGIQMGSGRPPSEGQGYAAYHRDYFALVSGPTEAGSPLVHDSYICGTDEAIYTYSATPAPVSQAAGPWLDYFYYGGTASLATTISAQ